jgi:hypothetical protein
MASQYWDNTFWADDYQYLYSYNANNLDTSEVIQSKDTTSWLNYQRYAYTYDVKSNQISQIIQDWSDSAWMKTNQYDYTYDTANIMKSETSRQFYDGDMLTGDSTYWYFHFAISGINQLSVVSNQLSVYPNPNNGKFTMQLLIVSSQWSVEVYNVLGENVYSQFNIKNPKFSIDLSSLPNGVYFLQLKSEQGVFNSKVIIQK